MNTAFLLGRLVRDCEVRYTTTGKCVCQFTLAVDRPFTNQDGQREADFINVVIWGKTAELAGNSLQKGHRVLVRGRIQTRSYDAKDGSKRYVTEVIADSNGMEFIERKGYTPGAATQAAAAGDTTPGSANMESFGEQMSFDEEIPF